MVPRFWTHCDFCGEVKFDVNIPNTLGEINGKLLGNRTIKYISTIFSYHLHGNEIQVSIFFIVDEIFG